MREEFINFVKKELPKILLIQAKKDGIPIIEENIKLINNDEYLEEYFNNRKISEKSSVVNDIKSFMEILIAEMNYLCFNGYTKNDKIGICFKELDYYFDNINLNDSIEKNNYFYKLISTLYHEYSHLKDNYYCQHFETNFVNEHPEFVFEDLILTEDYNFYYNNHNKFDFEQRAIICSMELMDENYPEFDAYKKYDYVSSLVNFINYDFDYIMYEFDNVMKKHFENIQQEDPDYLFICLYENGRKKTVEELLNDEKFNHIVEVFPTVANLIICNRLKEFSNSNIDMSDSRIVEAIKYKKERYDDRNKKINDLINKFLDKYDKNKTK